MSREPTLKEEPMFEAWAKMVFMAGTGRIPFGMMNGYYPVMSIKGRLERAFLAERAIRDELYYQQSIRGGWYSLLGTLLGSLLGTLTLEVL